VSALWSVYFQYGTASGSSWWYVRATTNGTGANAVGTYDYGRGRRLPPAGTVSGEFHPGANGTFVFHLPRAAIGSPPDGAVLTQTWSDTHARSRRWAKACTSPRRRDRLPTRATAQAQLWGPAGRRSRSGRRVAGSNQLRPHFRRRLRQGEELAEGFGARQVFHPAVGRQHEAVGSTNFSALRIRPTSVSTFLHRAGVSQGR